MPFTTDLTRYFEKHSVWGKARKTTPAKGEQRNLAARKTRLRSKAT